jgi:gluconokinase
LNPARSSLLLAIDVGSSSTRSALFDMQARQFIATAARKTYRLVHTRDGGAELPVEILRRAVMNCLDATLRRYRADRSLRHRPIIAVGTSCFWHALIGTDASGRALTPIYTWADSRCRRDAARLRAELSERKIHARTGCMLRASFWPAKLLWLRRTRPRLFRQVKFWMSAGEWLQWQICGEARCGCAMASGTGLFNPSKLAWDGALLRRCRVSPAMLNRLGEESLFCCARFAKRFPELREARWFPAIGDGAAGNLGSGASRAGIAAINIGTSAAVRVMCEGKTARAPFGLFCYRVDARRYVIGGAVSNAGNLRQWCRRVLRLPEHASVGTAGRSHGLIVLPFWVSERAPTWPEDLSGAIVGLSQATAAGDILQATTEAVYQRLAQIADRITRTKGRQLRYIVSGRFATSQTDMQLLADVLGRPVEACAEPEASLRGAAVFALEKLGMKAPAPPLGRVYRARAALVRHYARGRRRQEQLEQLLLASRGGRGTPADAG